jgi:hypothetical protein
VFSIATSFTHDAQGIADNTVTTIVAYLVVLAALLLAHRVLLGFESRPVDRPVKRWVIVADESRSARREEPAPVEADDSEEAVAVEAGQREPAA